MSLLEAIFSDDTLRADPPVLVDVGAAGGVSPAWRRIAQYSVGVGFEPDAREAAPLHGAQAQFRRWTFCPCVVVPEISPGGEALLHLTRSPQCSSLLRPNAAALGEWSFADLFAVEKTRAVPARTLREALAEQGVSRIDWLKCDTQGLDLKLFQSLPVTWRTQLLAVEFEPGLLDAYEGEDKVGEVLTAMNGEPFWLAGFDAGGVARGRPELLQRRLGGAGLPWVRRLAQAAPGWANLRYLRDFSKAAEPLDRRSHLLSWVFATLAGHHGEALALADHGTARFRENLFERMTDASERRLKWQMLRRLPGAIWRRFRRV